MTEENKASVPWHSSRPRQFLFVLWDGGGTIPIQLTLARQLVRRGHRVRVLADPSSRADAEAAGCTFIPFQRAPHKINRSMEADVVRDWEARTPWGKFIRLRDRVMCGPALGYAEDVLHELQREPADVIAVDVLLLGAAVGAERAGVPFVFLCHSVYLMPRPGVPAPGLGFLPMPGPIGRLRDALSGYLVLRMLSAGLPALNNARTKLGLERIKTMAEVFDRAEWLLALTSQAFDFQSDHPTPKLHYVGGQVDDPSWTGQWDSPWPADHPDPLVVVSLSTTYQAQTTLLQRVVDALGRLRVRGLVTTGPAVDPTTLRVPGNVIVRRAAPHGIVFREAHAVVTHAGHGTVIQALTHGLPLVCIPFDRDQPDIAARVVHGGVGLRLSRRANVAQLQKAIRRVLEELNFRVAAQRLASTIREEAGTARGVQELERLTSLPRNVRSQDLSSPR